MDPKLKRKIDNAKKRAGVTRVNSPKMTPDHPRKKAVVVGKVGDTVRVIRFGDQSKGHNYSPEARRAYKARHAATIKGATKLDAAYWANQYLWGGPGKSKKAPPKGQTRVFGKRKG